MFCFCGCSTQKEMGFCLSFLWIVIAQTRNFLQSKLTKLLPRKSDVQYRNCSFCALVWPMPLALQTLSLFFRFMFVGDHLRPQDCLHQLCAKDKGYETNPVIVFGSGTLRHSRIGETWDSNPKRWESNMSNTCSHFKFDAVTLYLNWQLWRFGLQKQHVFDSNLYSCSKEKK